MGKHVIWWRWLGIILIFVGLLVIWRGQIWQGTGNNFGQFEVLPSGEEQVVKDYQDAYISSSASREGSWIVIPKMGVDSAIYEGGAEMLNRGVWHLPRTSTPDKGSNTVLSAHRWLYEPPDPRTFWDIDKMEIGDEIYVRWLDQDYTYRVIEIEVITPDRVDILKPTEQPTLTIFSCTPLYSTSHRLVVKAELVE